MGKILDFGISKVLTTSANNFSLTKTGTVVGSPAYMSPEQAAGRDDIDGRADVWSLGVVLFEALTGQLPHEAPNYNALMVRILTQDVLPIANRKPDLPPAVCHIVDACLGRERETRPTAGQLSSMLESGVRELRANRFKRSGGRRRDDTVPEAMGHHNAQPTAAVEVNKRMVAIGAAGFVAGTVFGGVATYLMIRLLFFG